MQKYFGTTHIFTSKDDSEIINIKAGAGETLNVTGHFNGTFSGQVSGQTTELAPEVTNINEMGVLDMYEVNTIDYDNSTLMRNQGQYIAAGRTSDDVMRIIYSGQYGSNSGRVAIYSYTKSTNSLYLEATISAPVVTHTMQLGIGCAIDRRNCLKAAVSDHGSNVFGDYFPKIFFYERTGTTWNHAATNDTAYGSYMAMSGPWTVIGCVQSGLKVANNYTSNTTLVNLSGVPGDPDTEFVTIDFYDSVYSLAYVNPKTGLVGTYAYLGGSWTFMTYLDRHIDSGKVKSITQFDNILAYCTDSKVYCCSRIDPYENFELKSVFDFPNLVGISYSYGYSSPALIVCTDSEITHIVYYQNTFIYYGENTKIENGSITTVSATRRTLFTGETGSGSYGLIRVYHLEVNGNTEDFNFSRLTMENKGFKFESMSLIKISSLQMAEVKGYKSPALLVDGDLTVLGQVNGQTKAQFSICMLEDSQTLTSGSNTKLTTCFSGYDGCINTVDVIFDQGSGTLYLNTKGLYLITYYVEFEADSNGTRYISIFKDFFEVSLQKVNPPSVGTANISMSQIIFNDVAESPVEFYAFQNSGGGLDVLNVNVSCVKLGI